MLQYIVCCVHDNNVYKTHFVSVMLTFMHTTFHFHVAAHTPIVAMTNPNAHEEDPD